MQETKNVKWVFAADKLRGSGLFSSGQPPAAGQMAFPWGWKVGSESAVLFPVGSE